MTPHMDLSFKCDLKSRNKIDPLVYATSRARDEDRWREVCRQSLSTLRYYRYSLSVVSIPVTG